MPGERKSPGSPMACRARVAPGSAAWILRWRSRASAGTSGCRRRSVRPSTAVDVERCDAVRPTTAWSTRCRRSRPSSRVRRRRPSRQGGGHRCPGRPMMQARRGRRQPRHQHPQPRPRRRQPRQPHPQPRPRRRQPRQLPASSARPMRTPDPKTTVEAEPTPAPRPVGPRITRPEPIATPIGAASAPPPVEHQRSFIRTATIAAVLLSFGALIGFVGADLTREAREGRGVLAAGPTTTPLASDGGADGGPIASTLERAAEHARPERQRPAQQRSSAHRRSGDGTAGDDARQPSDLGRHRTRPGLGCAGGRVGRLALRPAIGS